MQFAKRVIQQNKKKTTNEEISKQKTMESTKINNFIQKKK